jgi:hypothetical protein
LPTARSAIDEAIELKVRAGDKNLAIGLLRRAEVAAAQGQDVQARTDAARALEEARGAGQEDFAGRARLWLALYELDRDPAAGAAPLQALVAELLPLVPAMRPATRALLDRAVQELDRRKPG